MLMPGNGSFGGVEKFACETSQTRYILRVMKNAHPCLAGVRVMVMLTVGLLLAGACSNDQEPDSGVTEAPTRHLGLWESVKRSNTGMGDAVEFEANGTTRRFRVSVNDVFYRIEGDSLIYRGIVPEGVQLDSADIPRVAVKFNVTRDTLMKINPPHTYWLERIAGERVPGRPIVGSWRVRRSTHNITIHKFEQYGADGILHERTPGVMDEGFYSISSDTLFLMYEDKPKRQIHFEIFGDTLSLARFPIIRDSLSDSVPPYFFSRYVRVGDRAWYFLGE